MLNSVILAVAFYSFIPIISTTTDVVEVQYEEQGKFLALLPINLTISAKAYANGKVEVNYPWYSFLTVTKKDKIESEMRVAVDNAMRLSMVGSVQASGEPVNKTFSASEAEGVVRAMKHVLAENIE